MEKNHYKNKLDCERLIRPVQVLLKESEYKILDALRRESPFPSNAAYVRSLILIRLREKRQTELF
jgi:hypothetical protein